MSKFRKELEYIKIRNQVYLKLEELVAKEGYIKVEPDYFEPYDWFVKNNVRIDPKSMVKLIDPKGEVKLLRPDITTNIIKQISPYWEDASVLKLFYNATTFRQSMDTITQERQFGIEYLGDETAQSETEIIRLVLEMFERFESNFILNIGNIVLLEDLFVDYDLITQNEIKQALLKRDKAKYLVLTNSSVDEVVLNLFELSGSITEVVKRLNLMSSSNSVEKYKTFLENIQDSLSEEDRKKIKIDLALVPEFDYYCGIVYQGFIEGLSKPILAGGRYDKLTKQYGQMIPAVGISFDVKSYIKEVNNETFGYRSTNG